MSSSCCRDCPEDDIVVDAQFCHSLGGDRIFWTNVNNGVRVGLVVFHRTKFDDPETL